MIVRRPSSRVTTSSTITATTAASISSSSSTTSSRKTPWAFADEWDADDEDAMSTGDSAASTRPLSVAIPPSINAHAPYCPRRPTLREILANKSGPPWTLAAFMAYLSNNHCLETLEFTMDAGRYKKHYAKMMSRAADNGLPPGKDREYVQALWQRLVEAYIQPNGSREVNLPSGVRDPILRLRPTTMPPSPESLDPAVVKIYELMEDSVLVPFLNSVYPQTAHPAVQSCPFTTSSADRFMSRPRTYEDGALYGPRPQLHPSSPILHHVVEPHAYSYSPQSSRSRQTSPLALPGSPHKTRFSVKLTPCTSSPAAPVSSGLSTIEAVSDAATLIGSGYGPGMTDDSGSASSPTNDGPMTPPMSPYGSDVQSLKRDSGMWKKLGRLSGMKVGRKKSHSALKVDEG